ESPPEKSTDTGPSVVAVTVDSSAVAFSVPTVGNLLVPLNVAPPPPANPMKGAVAIRSGYIEVEKGIGSQVEQIGVTGISGSRPAPLYPQESLANKEQGTVVLQIEVDASGRVTAVTVKESSGLLRLERAAADHVRRHWFFEG